jgi:hypothetical protein
MPALAAIKTPLNSRKVFDAFKSCRPTLSTDALFVLVAHSALECGFWVDELWNFGLGNVKASESWTGQYVYRKCGENIAYADAVGLVADNPGVVTISRRYTESGVDKAAILIAPPDPLPEDWEARDIADWCRFRAYDSLTSAVEPHLRLLQYGYPEAWAAASKGDAEGYARSLKARKYFSAELEHYLRGKDGKGGLMACLAQVRRELANTSNSSNDSPKAAPMPDIFSFKYLPTEPIRQRVWRCCTEVLAGGPMGNKVRPEWYASFINCGLKPAGRVGDTPVNSIASWATSCALFDRAIACACGRPTTIAVNASPMVVYMGVSAGPQHPAWIPNDGKRQPGLGDFGYWAPNWQSNMGHTEIFGPPIEGKPGWYHTAGGGGGTDGTGCSMREKSVTGKDSLNRPLLGWFDCEKVGIPYEKPKDDTKPAAPVDLPKPTPVLIDLPPEQDPPAPLPPVGPTLPSESPSAPEPSPVAPVTPDAPRVKSGLPVWVGGLVVAVVVAILLVLERC